MNLKNHSGNYLNIMDNHRKTEFKRLKDGVYLDHAGTSLYAGSQLESIFQNLSIGVYGNPHSRNESSQQSTDIIEQVRHRVVQFFNTSLDKYSVIFTSGATGAIKLLAETFDWNENSNYAYLEDNHTSVLGIRSVAKRYGAKISCISSEDLHNLACSHKSSSRLFENVSNCLFCLPSQSNFCGRKYPLSWISDVQNGLLDFNSKYAQKRKWYVLLDVAAMVGTSPLNLSVHEPDFVCFSFHKIFGYPTGLGCLLVHHSAISSLATNDRYFGGGSVEVASAKEQFEKPRVHIEERLEPGTISFLDILSVKHGFNTLQILTGNKNVSKAMSAISGHTFYLAQFVHRKMKEYRHSNGQATVILYCHDHFEDSTTQGAIVNFNLLQADGQFIGFAKVESVAVAYGIHLRTGCMCNPGACQKYLGLSFEKLQQHFEAGHVCGDDKDLIDGQPTGSVRISFGYMSTMDDALRFLHMIETCFVDCGKDEAMHYLPQQSSCGWVSEKSGSFEDSCRKPLWKSPDVDIEIDEMRKSHLARLRNGDGGGEQHDEALETSIAHRPDEAISIPNVRRDLDVRQENKLEDLFCNYFSKRQLDQSCCDGRITAITLYPIKSCGGFQVKSWKVGPRGFLYDRNWAIVTSNGFSLTQKKEPKLCLIRPEIDLNQQILILNYKEMSSFHISLKKSTSNFNEKNLPVQRSRVCGDKVETFDCGDEVANWLQKALQREDCRLFQQCSYSDRKSHTQQRNGTSSENNSIRFSLSLANEAQFLLLNHQSAKFLARHIPLIDSEDWNEDILVHKLLARFRGNLVVDGVQAFSEENWTHIQIAENLYKVEGPCNRCQMICIDQDTAVKSKEPFSTLATIRNKKIQFGVHVNKTEESEEVSINVGDPVIILNCET